MRGEGTRMPGRGGDSCAQRQVPGRGEEGRKGRFNAAHQQYPNQVEPMPTQMAGGQGDMAAALPCPPGCHLEPREAISYLLLPAEHHILQTARLTGLLALQECSGDPVGSWAEAGDDVQGGPLAAQCLLAFVGRLPFNYNLNLQP